MTPADAHAWAANAIRRLLTNAGDGCDGDGGSGGSGGYGGGPTPLRPLPLPDSWGVTAYLKDESAHPTGSLKYRLVRAMYREAVERGEITRGTTVVAATSGAVAAAGAYFAALLELPFVAVVPKKAPPEALDRIERYGGRWQPADRPAALQDDARRLAGELDGHFLDHFSDAERALACDRLPTVADEVFDQLAGGPHPVPEWIVTGAGTGATSASVGRYLRRHGRPTRLAVVDPENSAYFPAWASGCAEYSTGMPSRIAGIGRPRTEPGFLPSVIDLVIPVPDTASVAAMRWLRDAAGIAAGPSTGTNLWGLCHLVARMLAEGARGSVVTLIGDGAEPYRRSYHDEAWTAAHGLDPGPHLATLEEFMRTGAWPPGER